MTNDNRYEVLRPFGPSVARFTMPAELINTLNEYTDKIISDEKKSKDQDAGNKLAGQVTQEFDLDKKFIVSSGLLKFLISIELIIFFPLFFFKDTLSKLFISSFAYNKIFTLYNFSFKFKNVKFKLRYT